MAVGTGKEHESMVGVSGCLGFGKEAIPRNDDGRGVGGTAALRGDSTGMRPIEAKEVGKMSAGGFLCRRSGS